MQLVGGDQVAAVAAAAGAATRPAFDGRLAQPGAGQFERELELADAVRAVHQHRMAALRAQRLGKRRGEPGQREDADGVRFAAHHQPRAPNTAATRAATSGHAASASMRTMRRGAAAARAR